MPNMGSPQRAFFIYTYTYILRGRAPSVRRETSRLSVQQSAVTRSLLDARSCLRNLRLRHLSQRKLFFAAWRAQKEIVWSSPQRRSAGEEIDRKTPRVANPKSLRKPGPKSTRRIEPYEHTSQQLKWKLLP